MNTVLSGVALAAILALASPAWAQAPGAQPSQPESPTASTPAANKAQVAPGTHARKTSHKNNTHAAKNHHAAHARPMHRKTTARAGGSGPTDNVANQLNRDEAQKLTGSSMPPTENTNMGAPNQPHPIQGQ